MAVSVFKEFTQQLNQVDPHFDVDSLLPQLVERGIIGEEESSLIRNLHYAVKATVSCAF